MRKMQRNKTRSCIPCEKCSATKRGGAFREKNAAPRFVEAHVNYEFFVSLRMTCRMQWPGLGCLPAHDYFLAVGDCIHQQVGTVVHHLELRVALLCYRSNIPKCAIDAEGEGLIEQGRVELV